jgi:hypothetical protein
MARPSKLAIAAIFVALGCNSTHEHSMHDAGHADAQTDAPGVQCECACTPTPVRFSKPADEDCWEISCDSYCGGPGFGTACGVN